MVLPSSNDELSVRVQSFQRHRMNIVKGCLVLHDQVVTSKPLHKYLIAEGFSDADRVENSRWGWGMLTGLAIAPTTYYVLASPLQNVRDNDLWRDLALIGIPIGLIYQIIDTSHFRPRLAIAYNRELMRRLNLELRDLPPDEPSRGLPPEK